MLNFEISSFFFFAIICSSFTFSWERLFAILNNFFRVAPLNFSIEKLFESSLVRSGDYSCVDKTEGIRDIYLEKLIASDNPEQQLLNFGLDFKFLPLLIVTTIKSFSLRTLDSLANKVFNDFLLNRVYVFSIILHLMIKRQLSFFSFAVFGILIFLQLKIDRSKHSITHLIVDL